MKPNLPIFAHVEIERIHADHRFFRRKINYGTNDLSVSLSHPFKAALGQIVVLILLAVPGLSQTTIVAARNSNQVVLAADSKMSGSGGTPRSCKIRHCGDAFLATSGLVRIQDRDIWAWSLEEACKGQALPKERVAMLEKAIVKWLADSISLARGVANLPEIVHFLNKEAVVSFVLVGYRNDSYIYQRGFGHDDLGNVVISPFQHDFDAAVPADNVNQVLLGKFEGITRLRNNYRAYGAFGLAKGAEFLVNLMIVEDAAEVGPPVDVLVIDKTGPHWIQRKPECEEKKAQPTKPTPKPARRRPRR